MFRQVLAEAEIMPINLQNLQLLPTFRACDDVIALWNNL